MSNQPLNPDSLAEQLDALLPADSPGEINGGHEDDPLLNAAAQLAAAPRPELSPEAMARIQAQMLQAFDQQQFEHSARRVRVHPALRWVLVAGLAFVVLFAVSVPSALASVPGDWLYPVKGIIEQAELGLATSPESRAAVYLTFAERRTQEASVLAGQGAFDPTLFQAAVSNLAQASDTADSAGLALPVLQARGGVGGGWRACWRGRFGRRGQQTARVLGRLYFGHHRFNNRWWYLWMRRGLQQHGV